MWRPIEEYDKLKKKPEYCIFWVAAEEHERDYCCLRQTVSLTRTMGRRRITHYMVTGQPDS